MVARSTVAIYGLVTRSDAATYGDPGLVGAKLRPTANGESCISRSTRNEVTLDSLAYTVASDEESDEDEDTDFRMIDDAEINALNQLRSLDSGKHVEGDQPH